jgi:Zn finger protein HypA/HybF involved in hydrogenase expression
MVFFGTTGSRKTMAEAILALREQSSPPENMNCPECAARIHLFDDAYMEGHKRKMKVEKTEQGTEYTCPRCGYKVVRLSCGFWITIPQSRAFLVKK